MLHGQKKISKTTFRLREKKRQLTPRMKAVILNCVSGSFPITLLRATGQSSLNHFTFICEPLRVREVRCSDCPAALSALDDSINRSVAGTCLTLKTRESTKRMISQINACFEDSSLLGCDCILEPSTRRFEGC